MTVQSFKIDGKFSIAPGTKSMLPNLKPKTHVQLFFKIPSFGDVIVFKEKDLLIAHRFFFILKVPLKGYWLLTKGDSCLTFDLPHKITSYVGNLGDKYKNREVAIKSMMVGIVFSPLLFYRIFRNKIFKRNAP